VSPRATWLAAAACTVLLAGCGDRTAVRDGVTQTKLPGHVTAGGPTSGQVIARSGAAAATQPAGTPGIPQGAGGNPGGTAMGGSTVAQAAAGPGGATHPGGDRLGAAGSSPVAAAISGAAPAPAGVAPAPAPVGTPGSGAAASLAQEQARALATSMDAVAARWRSRAAAQGWAVNAPTPVDPLPGIQTSATQAAPAGQPQGVLTQAGAQPPIRSEKLGTAPPSRDVKTGVRANTPAVLDPKSPTAAEPR
jgi:hypothetical protein